MLQHVFHIFLVQRLLETASSIDATNKNMVQDMSMYPTTTKVWGSKRPEIVAKANIFAYYAYTFFYPVMRNVGSQYEHTNAFTTI